MPELMLNNGLEVPQVWAMRESDAVAMQRRMLTLEVDPKAVRAASMQVVDPTLRAGNLAIVRVVGPLSKRPSMSRLLGYTDTATLPEIAAAVSRAAQDETVSGILLYVDSPGGTVAGTELAAEAVWQARRSGKPVWAYCQDCACSAGWWIASQAEQVYANPTADLVNLGVYLLHLEVSKLLEEWGVKVNLFASGERKGAGNPYVVTEQHRTELQEGVDSTHELFVDAVARGRGMSRADVVKVADGRVMKGSAAVGARMVNGLAQFGEVVRAMSSGVGSQHQNAVRTAR